MQFSIFHSITESTINELLYLLNDDLKPKEQYKLISFETLKNEKIILLASNGNDFLVNILDKNGNIPLDSSANWRTSSHIINEFGNNIPEFIVRIRIAELNKQMLDKGQSWEQIELFWNNIFKDVKK